ncbi:MAG: hypothetical protein IPP13_11060 [Kouleothrix sp.]|jgi:predicted Zn-dependent peptidase|nr:hypothetical protein [Kouleothrix sp.]
MQNPPPQSYMLRLWREHHGAPVRITVVLVGQPDERRHFSTLAECFAWLNEQATRPDPPQLVVPGSAPIVAQKHAPEK